MMLKKVVLPVMLTGIIGTGVVAEVVPTTPARAGNASTGESDAVAKAAASTSLTADAASAARAFKSSLSPSQRTTLQYSFSSSKKESGWSNLPTSIVARNGVAIEDLNAAQLARLRTLLKTILSSQGYSDEEGIRKADTYLRRVQQSGGGGDPRSRFGEGLYYVAFFGTPSRSKSWTIQFGGHHYTLHMTFRGSAVSNTPYFVGVEPRTAFKLNGRNYQPLEDEASALFGAVRSLRASQRATAKLSRSFDEVLVGAQKDGQFPTRQGITVSALSKAQQEKVTRAVRSYVGDMPTRQAKARMAQYTKQYSKTKLAWSGSTDGATPGAYVRIQGPRVWIEIATQSGRVLSGTHYHSIERDIETDYRAGR